MQASVFILAARSSVFKAMFKSGMREAKEMKLLLDDVPEAQLKLFLHALNSDELPDTMTVTDGTAVAVPIATTCPSSRRWPSTACVHVV